MFKFLHTADIHLDSPLKGLEAHEDAPVEEIRGATRRAFDNLIDFAIEEEVDFVLIAGDLYDPGHSVRNNLETLDSVEEVRIIKEAVA